MVPARKISLGPPLTQVKSPHEITEEMMLDQLIELGGGLDPRENDEKYLCRFYSPLEILVGINSLGNLR